MPTRVVEVGQESEVLGAQTGAQGAVTPAAHKVLKVATVKPVADGASIIVQGEACVSLGEVSGNLELDISLGNIFTGTVIGDTVFSVVGRQYGLVTMYFVQANGGGHTVSFDGVGGFTVIDPGGFNEDIFPNKASGSRSISLWSAGRGALYALGVNATSPA